MLGRHQIDTMGQQRDQHHGRENLDGGEKGAASPSSCYYECSTKHQASMPMPHLGSSGVASSFAITTISRGQGFGEAVGSGRHRRRGRA